MTNSNASNIETTVF